MREARSRGAKGAAFLRRALDGIYLGSACLGAASILGIGLLIAAQVVGREFGFQVKGADDLTAWSVVAAGFLPLAHTYRSNGHVRVTLLVERLHGVARRLLEFLVLLLALHLVGFLCLSAFDMVRDSLRFGDLSNGLIVIPLWIPQFPMALGSLIFLVAIIDDIVVSIAGGMPAHRRAAQAIADSAAPEAAAGRN